MNSDILPEVNSDIERLKRQALQRFIGAAVLVIIAVIGLPFLLDSQPRSLPSTIAIDIPKMGSTTATTPATKPAPLPDPIPAAAVTPPPTAPQPTTSPAATPPSIPTAAPAPTPITKNNKPAAPLVFAQDDGQRAAALLSGQRPPNSGTAAPNQKGKFVVQAGSYTESDKLAAAREKLDKAGLAHYTQPAPPSKDGASRTRLRLTGPFSTKEEAQTAQTKVTQLGIAAMVLKP